ncbi:MAG: hypothetical protein ACKO0V_02350 [bacterium]
MLVEPEESGEFGRDGFKFGHAGFDLLVAAVEFGLRSAEIGFKPFACFKIGSGYFDQIGRKRGGLA